MDTHNERREIRRLKWIFGTAYAVQGTSGLSRIPTLYFIKFALGLGEAGGQLFQSLIGIGWLIKPLWGFISDRFPLFGYRRKSWFCLMAILSIAFWGVNAILAFAKIRVPAIFLVTFNLAFATYAFVDVVGDALMVEHGRRLKRVGSFVNLQWTMWAISNAVVAIISGWFTQQIQAGDLAYWMIFFATGIPPLATVLVGFKNIPEERLPRRLHRKPIIPKAHISLRKRLFFLSHKVRMLFQAFGVFRKDNKVLWLLVLFIVMWNFSPSVGYIEKSYLIDVRDFTPQTFGVIFAVWSIAALLSILVYRWAVNRFSRIRWHHYLYAMVAIGALSFPLRFYLYLEVDHPLWKLFSFSLPAEFNPLPSWNRYQWFDLITDTILGFATLPAFLIPLTIAGEAVRLKSAGMSYAFLMSVVNAANMFEGVVGSGLYGLFGKPQMAWFLDRFHGSWFDIAGAEDPRTLILQIFVYISLLFTLLAIPFVYLLKREFAREAIEVHLGKAQ